MRRATAACSLGLLAIALFAPARSGRAQAQAVPPILAGTFAYPDDQAHARAIIMSALQGPLQSVPGLLRDVVRGQIEQRITIPQRITVALPSPIVSVTYEGERTTVVASPLGGSTTVLDRNGESIPVTQRLSAGWLEQTFTGPNGTLRVLLSTEPDGQTLHADGTMTGERLSQPIPVRLDYRRVQ